jgi:phenylpropionate dioxygenase-like ring-hydroxylating dioxygenase large terminal subunit
MQQNPASKQRPVRPEDLTLVPYWVFQHGETYKEEQQHLFQGNLCDYLCLEVEVARAGDFRTTFVGDAPVIVTRDGNGEVHVFENRCAIAAHLSVSKTAARTNRGFSASTMREAVTSVAI